MNDFKLLNSSAYELSVAMDEGLTCAVILLRLTCGE